MDGEGTFSVRVGKDLSRKHKIRVAPIFSIELHIRDINLLEKIKDYFGVGTIIKRIRKGKITGIYNVQSVSDLKNVILPHFKKYPLITQKGGDFILFSSCIEIMFNKKHLTLDDILNILSLKASMGKNKGLSLSLQQLFPYVKPSKRPLVTSQDVKSKDWLIGFIAGEGCFYVKINIKSNSISNITPTFMISQHSRDLALIRNIKNYLNCGVVEVKSTRNEVVFVVYKFSNLYKDIIPLFENPLLLGIKSLDFKDFMVVCDIIKNKLHLTEEYKKKILFIKNRMNTKRQL